MAADQSITTWISLLRTGDHAAAQPLWEAFFHRLVGLARGMLRGSPIGQEEEDVALSAIKSAFQGIENGKFPRLNDRDDLWSLLAKITRNKAVDAIKSARPAPMPGSEQQVELLVDLEPTPELAAQFADECRHLLALLQDENLPDPLLQGKRLPEIALLKLEGCTNPVIANRLGRPLRAIERSLKLIRTIWQSHLSCQ